MARSALLLNSLALCLVVLGCSLSTQPTYIKEDIDKVVQDICKNEYKLDVKARVVGRTLWVYLPLEDLLEKAKNPEKYTDKFSILTNKAAFTDDTFKIDYAVKTVPEEQKSQEFKFNKDALDKNSQVWKVVRRVLFSTERTRESSELKFVCMITADIKTGLVMKDVVYITDLKKVSYEFISITEYQHRAVQDMGLSLEVIGDKEGKNIDYKDFTLEDFIAMQIQQRIRLKFQKPEVEKNVDIDQEILKIAVYTIKTYSFKDFREIELNNVSVNPGKKVVLNQAAVWARPTN